MKKNSNFFFRYLVFWLCYFILIRFLFIVYHVRPFSDEKLTDILLTFLYGFRMDLSMASYFSVLPFLVISLSVFKITFKKLDYIIRWYTYTLLIVMSFLAVVDMELFSFWGYRLDGTPLKYLNTPGEMLASSLSSPWYLLIPLLIALIAGSIYFYKKIIRFEETIEARPSGKYSSLIAFSTSVLIIAVLILPIRGGWQQIPMNESSVYFSSSNLSNQTAVNLPWTFIHSLLEKSYVDTNPYEYTDYTHAADVINDLYPEDKNTTVSLLKNQKNNVLIILWESFTAKADIDSVTPEFQQLKKEGVFFQNVYASGDRSDKGIVAVLSGYPALPANSIIMNPNKSMKLPSMVKDFAKEGYNSAFYYGGELAFANMNSYLVQNKFVRTVSILDFEKKDMNSKWGAHDEVVFRRLNTELDTMKQPFFSMIFTLSSHEPFETPMAPTFKGNEKAILFLNSLHYTDKCLGDFIREAKRSSWWNNTLIVVIADHGHVLPGNDYATHARTEFKIPMLWLGGALAKKDTIISFIASQTDLAATLEAQFGKQDSAFVFSRNIFSPRYKESAYYAFNDGFGLVKPQGYLLYDNISKKIIAQEDSVSDDMLQQGRAIQQITYRNYLNK
ncbi:MAG TPA: sulfatase-like hydrolase/transferase [Cytophagaceae bacterium]|nr:sulfatase-like hydrolase/transferase [Cytophagaceae bacterium]